MEFNKFWHFNITIAIATTERFGANFAATVSKILENHSKSFFNQNFRKKISEVVGRK